VHVAGVRRSDRRPIPSAAGRPYARMLTVDYDRLGLVARDRLLDLGCGGGRHAFEALRRGARVVALDADAAEVKDAGALMEAMIEAGEVPLGSLARKRPQSTRTRQRTEAAGAATVGDALALPFPDATFERVIA